MKSPALITCSITATLIAIQIFNIPVASAQGDPDRVADQFRQFCLQESTDHGQRILDDVELPTSKMTEVMQLIQSQKPDGSWPDLNYESHARSAWEPGEELTRLLTLTVYARRQGTPPADAQQCIEATHRGLKFWMAHDFKCPNWWYNEIGGPKLMGNIALLLKQDLQPDELKFITGTILTRSKVGSMTGQNRVWLAGNGVMRGALLRDDGLLKKAADVIAEEIRVTTGEGIQPDWSFHQHGPQQQFGNYGSAFAVEITKWINVLRGTSYALSDEKVGMLRNYLLQGQNWVTWNGSMDISSCGRQLFPDSQIKKASVIRGVMKSMANLDTEKSKDYLAFAARNSAHGSNDLVGTQMFWRSGYLVHRQPDWAVTLKMSSARVIGGETVNTENLSGLHLADGATFTYRTGREYENIFPVWDWRLIPGTTEVLDKTPLTWLEKAEHAKTTFVGGATDGTNAAAAMDFHRGQLTAKKAWFFAGDAVVCLGSDIACGENEPVMTTIDQCLLTGQVLIQQQGKQSTLSSESQKLGNADWIEHAGTRYTSLSPQALVLGAQTQTGNWHAVYQNPSTPKPDVTKKVFILGIDHGSTPRGGSYAYSTSPAGTSPASIILANTEKLQAVKIGAEWSAAIFWTPGDAELNGLKIEVDQPCIVLVKDRQITIADPTEKLASVHFKIDGQSKEIQLPQGGDAGKSAAVGF